MSTVSRHAISFATLGLVCSLFANAASAIGSEPEAWLQKMLDATRTLNYDGTFVYRSGDRVETMRIVHRYSDDGERERLVSLEGEVREVIRDNDVVLCILPENETVHIGKQVKSGFQASALFSIGTLPGHYRIELDGSGRVAGRAAKRLRVSPTDSMRYGYRLWLDESTGLLLRSALVDGGDRVLEEIAYTSLELPEFIPESSLVPSIDSHGFRRVESAAKASGQRDAPTDWRIEWKPDGFTLVERVAHPPNPAHAPMEHWVYSDGLASVSIFIETADASTAALDGTSSIGAVNAYGRRIDDYQVTVVGEVPAPTVERLAHSIARQ